MKPRSKMRENIMKSKEQKKRKSRNKKKRQCKITGGQPITDEAEGDRLQLGDTVGPRLIGS